MQEDTTQVTLTSVMKGVKLPGVIKLYDDTEYHLRFMTPSGTLVLTLKSVIDSPLGKKYNILVFEPTNTILYSHKIYLEITADDHTIIRAFHRRDTFGNKVIKEHEIPLNHTKYIHLEEINPNRDDCFKWVCDLENATNLEHVKPISLGR